MSGVALLKPPTTIRGFAFQPGRKALILDCDRAGKHFPIKIALGLAGGGVYTFHSGTGTILLSRGVKGKSKEQGEKWEDSAANLLGLFTANRETAEALVRLCWQKEMILTDWPAPEGVQPVQPDTVANAAD